MEIRRARYGRRRFCLAEQRGKLRRIALIVEDRAFQRRLDFGENPRRDAGGERAEKQDFHVSPSPTQMIATIVALPFAAAKGLEAAPCGYQRTRLILDCCRDTIRKGKRRGRSSRNYDADAQCFPPCEARRLIWKNVDRPTGGDARIVSR